MTAAANSILPDDELPPAAEAEITRCWNLFNAAPDDRKPAALQDAAAALFAMQKINMTVHPECEAVVDTEIYRELDGMAAAAYIDSGEAEQIYAKARRRGASTEDTPNRANGHTAKPPTPNEADQGTSPAPANSDDRKKQQSTTKSKELVAFPLCAFENIRLDTERRVYLVKGLLPRAGLGVIWGPPKCGKSFWAMDLGLHIALGWQYRGRRVQQAPVVYIALEGREGLAARKEAFAQHHDVIAAPFYLMTTALNLAKQADVLIASIEAQLGDVKPGAVFIDTLNRSLVGSESKDEDMAAYLAGASRIEQKFGCLVPIVHHCGVAADRPRGHTSLSGAVEVQIAVDRGGQGEVVAKVELAKDFPEGAEIFSRLESVDLGADVDGDPITSLVVLPADDTEGRPARQKGTKGLSSRQRLALDALTECAAEHGQAPPSAQGLPASVRTVTMEQWKEQLFRSAVLERDGTNPRQDFKRIKTSLQARRAIGVLEDTVWRA